jgi:heptosyltransferase-2
MVDVQWDNVLVLQTGFLGDTVLTLPLLSEIKRRFPRARVTLFCSAQGKKLAADYSAVDDVIVDDKRGAHRGLLGLRRQAQLLRQRGFTLALTPHKSLRSALILYLARVPCRVGFRQSKGWFLFHRLVNRPDERHDVERNLSLLSAFGIAIDDCQRRFDGFGARSKLSAARNATLRQRLRIGINPGSVWATKRWHIEGYAQAIRLFKARWDCDVVLFGGPDDTLITAAINEASGVDCIDLSGKIDLAELPAALDDCDVLVSNDSGPMHIAVARGVPIVALFCATTPELGFYPYTDNAVVLHKNLPCRPCSTHGGRRCPLGTEDCIRLIRPEHVLEAVDRLLRRRARDRDTGRTPEFVFV